MTPDERLSPGPRRPAASVAGPAVMLAHGAGAPVAWRAGSRLARFAATAADGEPQAVRRPRRRCQAGAGRASGPAAHPAATPKGKLP